MSNMTDTKMKRWEKQRAQGRISFVFKVGVLFWGILTALMWSILMYFIDPQEPVWARPLLVLVIFPIAGFFWGFWVWSIIEKKYQSWMHTSGNT